MGFSDYFGRFWFAAEPIFGVVMTLVFLGILRNEALYAYPQLLDRVVVAVIEAALSCCIAWGIVDGIFYAWENHSISSRRNLIASYAKDEKQRDKGLGMIAEDLEDSHVSILNDEQKAEIQNMVLSNLSENETKERVPLKDDFMTILLDMGLNLGASLVIMLPIILLRSVIALPESLNIAVITAVILLFLIGVWVETRKSWRFRIRTGTLYAVLGVVISLLTWLLGG
jgi:VIT1/CCC1 family predicted Fe2+/Mn2+ transporter